MTKTEDTTEVLTETELGDYCILSNALGVLVRRGDRDAAIMVVAHLCELVQTAQRRYFAAAN